LAVIITSFFVIILQAYLSKDTDESLADIDEDKYNKAIKIEGE